MKYDIKKIVDHIVNSYRKAGRALEKGRRRNGGDMSSWMDQDVFDKDADAIQAAYDEGKFDDVEASQVDALMEKYSASDVYHLVASYFNATGKILNIQ